MGLYNRIVARCPDLECTGEIEWQSKAGPDECSTYRPSEVPTDVAYDVEGTWEECSDCGRKFSIIVAPEKRGSVRMTIR